MRLAKTIRTQNRNTKSNSRNPLNPIQGLLFLCLVDKKNQLLGLCLLLLCLVWLICCWVCVCVSGFVIFGFQF